MGPSDLLKPVIERNLGGTVHFGRVSMKPGKPTTFASVPVVNEDSGEVCRKPIFALPGNPASALVMFHIFVVPALRKLGGWADGKCELPRVRVKVCPSLVYLHCHQSITPYSQLRSTMPLDPRTEFHRVVIKAGREGLEAFSTGGQRSSRVASLNGANGLVILPPKATGEVGVIRTEMREGEEAVAVVIGEIEM
jgi:gephyrin